MSQRPNASLTAPGADADSAREPTTQAEVDEAMRAVPRATGAFYALHFRNFRLFFIGQLISVAGTWMQTVAQQWLVWQLTHSARWLGLVTGASAVPFVLLAIRGGQLADRYSRRWILVWTQTAAMLLAFLLAWLDTPRLSPIPIQAWIVVVVAALNGVVNAFNMPAQQAFVTDMVDDRAALGNAIALNSLRFNLARVLGPVLAGAVLVWYSAAMCFFLNGLSFIAVIISLLMMQLQEKHPSGERAPFKEAASYIWHTRSTLRIILLIGFSSIFVWPLSTLFPVLASSFHKGAAGFSAMTSANGLGAAVGGVVLAWLGSRFDRRVMIYGGCALFCFGLLLVAAAPAYLLVLGAILLAGFAMIVFGISAQTKVQEDVPDALRGRVLAVYSLVFNGFFSLGGLEFGDLAERLHARPAIALNAMVCLTADAALMVWMMADMRSQRLSRVETGAG